SSPGPLNRQRRGGGVAHLASDHRGGQEGGGVLTPPLPTPRRSSRAGGPPPPAGRAPPPFFLKTPTPGGRFASAPQHRIALAAADQLAPQGMRCLGAPALDCRAHEMLCPSGAVLCDLSEPLHTDAVAVLAGDVVAPEVLVEPGPCDLRVIKRALGDFDSLRQLAHCR